MRAGLGFDQMGSDAHPVAGFAHAAFEHIAHPEFPPDLLYVDRLALVPRDVDAGPLRAAWSWLKWTT